MRDGLQALGIVVLVLILAALGAALIGIGYIETVIAVRRRRDRRARKAADRELKERDRREALIVASKLDVLDAEDAHWAGVEEAWHAFLDAWPMKEERV